MLLPTWFLILFYWYWGSCVSALLRDEHNRYTKRSDAAVAVPEVSTQSQAVDQRQGRAAESAEQTEANTKEKDEQTSFIDESGEPSAKDERGGGQAVDHAVGSFRKGGAGLGSS